MDDLEFSVSVEKQTKITELKIKLAKFLRENNVEIRIKEKASIEILFDFYKDGEPVLLYSTNIKKEETDILIGDDLVK